jgi:hypothetical protein
MMSSPVYSNILIANTRTQGQDPNVLYAVASEGTLAPKLAVYNNGVLPDNCRWNIVYDNPGGQFRIEINDQSGNTYCLGVDQNAASGTQCVLVEYGKVGYCTAWAFSFPTRLLSAIGSGLHGYDGNLGTLSLDAGTYPNPIVWTFNSGVNQTWQYGPSMSELRTMPY